MQPLPTPFADVNTALHELRARIATILGDQFLGMYVIGSLALHSFDPHRSDVDFVVVTNADISEAQFHALQTMHAQFATSKAPWANRIEVVYVPQHALRDEISSAQVPQMEYGGALVHEPLEQGWIFQAYTLREYALPVAGPDPHTLVGSTSREAMRAAVATIAGSWLEQAKRDIEWLAWLRERANQQFVVLTLCRMLYSLETGDVASKPAAADWAQRALSQPWDAFIARTLDAQAEELPEHDLAATIDLIRLTAQRSRPK